MHAQTSRVMCGKWKYSMIGTAAWTVVAYTKYWWSYLPHWSIFVSDTCRRGRVFLHVSVAAHTWTRLVFSLTPDSKWFSLHLTKVAATQLQSSSLMSCPLEVCGSRWITRFLWPRCHTHDSHQRMQLDPSSYAASICEDHHLDPSPFSSNTRCPRMLSAACSPSVPRNLIRFKRFLALNCEWGVTPYDRSRFMSVASQIP